MTVDLEGQQYRLSAVRARFSASCAELWPAVDDLEWSGPANTLYRLCLLRLRADAATASDRLTAALAQTGRALDTLDARE